MAEELLIATDSVAATLDQLTTELGVGPRITATKRRNLVLVDLADTESSLFAREVADLELDVRCVLVVPLQVGIVRLDI